MNGTVADLGPRLAAPNPRLPRPSKPGMESPARLAFGPFDIDPATGELRREGRPIALQRQPARVLVALVTRAGRLVTREELRTAVWTDDTHVDFDRGINYCIRHLRAALDDEARSPRYIQTVARQGYRFVCPVATASHVATSTTPAGGPAARVGASAWRARWRLVAGSVAVTLAVVVEAAGDPETHHRVAMTVLQAVHDLLFRA